MEIRGKTIGGPGALQVRDALRAFLDIETPTSFENGEFKIERKRPMAIFSPRNRVYPMPMVQRFFPRWTAEGISTRKN